MKLLPGALSFVSVLDGGPLAFADDGQPGAVDHEMKAFSGSYTVEPDVEVLAAPREGRVVGSFEIDVHQGQDRLKSQRFRRCIE
jgi:hypothetical protein